MYYYPCAFHFGRQKMLNWGNMKLGSRQLCSGAYSLNTYLFLHAVLFSTLLVFLKEGNAVAVRKTSLVIQDLMMIVPKTS